MKTIVDKITGKELYATADYENILENEIAIESMRTEPMDNPHWDFKKEIYYDVEIEADSLSETEIDEKIKQLNYEMGVELSDTDFYYIRRLDTQEEVPLDVQNHRDSIRLKYENMKIELRKSKD